MSPVAVILYSLSFEAMAMLLACSLFHVHFLYFRMKHIFYRLCRLQNRLTKGVVTNLIADDCVYKHNFQVKFCSLSI